MKIAGIDLSSLRMHVRQYIERCRLDDGGYFFARIPPSSAMDTYYAVKSLSILGLEPEQKKATKQFFLTALKNSNLISINGLFAAVETLADLNSSYKLPARYLARINRLRNSMGGFGAVHNLDIEVVSELETTYRVLKILTRLNLDYDERQIVSFVLAFQNKDGGFGKAGVSTLASTFYATSIFKLLDYRGNELLPALNYLRGKESARTLNFIEDIYWFSHSMVQLGHQPQSMDWMLSFVMACQRTNGGFARKDVMGIPSLEYTFYAVSILKVLAAL